MSLLFKSRSAELERMDVETLSPEAASKILKTLEVINGWLGGVRATLWHFKRFSRHWSPGQTIRIIDWGTGGADIPRALIGWARPRGFHLKITGVDQNPVVLAYAKKACAAYPEIQLSQVDIKNMSAFQEPFDYAISSLCLHHLKDEEVVDLLKKSDRFTVRGFVMNDLKRSARAWAWIWTLSRLGRVDPIVRFDGPLSVKRAFTSDELRNLASQAGVSYAGVYTHFGYRLTLAGEKL